jgi:hypothetical protein
MVVKTFQLKHPVMVGELTVTELKLNRPKMKDFIAVGNTPIGGAGADAKLLASITGLSELVIEQLDIDDVSKLRFEIARIWESYFVSSEYESDGANPLPEAAQNI